MIQVPGAVLERLDACFEVASPNLNKFEGVPQLDHNYCTQEVTLFLKPNNKKEI